MAEAVAGTAVADKGGNRYVAALRHRDLRTLVVAFLIDGGASWSYNVVLIAYVFGRTHSASWVTALVTTGWIVGMLVGGYAGVVADRYDRRTVLIWSALLSGLVTIGIAAVVQTNAPLWLLVVAAAALKLVWSPTRPCTGALTPEVVPESDLVAANAIFALLESMIVFIGPGLGGLLLLTGRPVYGVLINTASYLIAAALYVSLRVRSHGDAEPGGKAAKQFADGIVTLVKHQKAFVLTIFLVLDSAVMNAAAVLTPALAKHLHGGGTGYSLLIAAGAFGGVIAAGLAQKLSSLPRMSLVIIAAIYCESVPLWLSVFGGSVAVALPLQAIAGVGMVILDVLAFTALQRDLPGAVLGRVLGTVDTLILAGAVGTSIMASALYSNFGIAVAMAVLGLVFPTIGLLGLPMLRGLDTEATRKLERLAPTLSLLDGLDLFAGAPRSLLEQLAASAEERTVAAGEVIIRQGDPSDALWILAEGTLVAHACTDGHEIDLPEIEAPGYVGELGLMNRTVRSATVTTATTCRLLHIPGDDFIAALENSAPSRGMLDRAGVRLSRTASARA
jgi:MFS family permease